MDMNGGREVEVAEGSALKATTEVFDAAVVQVGPVGPREGCVNRLN